MVDEEEGFQNKKTNITSDSNSGMVGLELQVVEQQSEMNHQRKEVDHLLPIQTQIKYNCWTMPSSYVFVYKFLPPPPSLLV